MERKLKKMVVNSVAKVGDDLYNCVNGEHIKFGDYFFTSELEIKKCKTFKNYLIKDEDGMSYIKKLCYVIKSTTNKDLNLPLYRQ